MNWIDNKDIMKLHELLQEMGNIGIFPIIDETINSYFVNKEYSTYDLQKIKFETLNELSDYVMAFGCTENERQLIHELAILSYKASLKKKEECLSSVPKNDNKLPDFTYIF